MFGAATLLMILPAQAQIRGGMRGGGVAPRMSSGFRSGPAPMGRGGFRAGPVMGGRTFAPPGRVFMGRPGVAPQRVMSARGFASTRGRFSLDPRFAHGHPITFPNCVGFPCFPGHHHHFKNSFFFGNPFFFGSPFFSPFSTVGYIPGFDYPYDYYGYQQPQQPVVAQSDNSADVQLALQVQQLSDEIADLRGEQALQQLQNRPAPPPGTSMSVVPPASATTFVFTNGQRLTAENYAITGQTLWILNEHAAKKYSLADLDKAATEQVNAANGVELHLPQPAKH